MTQRTISGRCAITAIILLLCFAGQAAAGPLEDGRAALRDGNFATALQILRPLAEQGDARAQAVLGFKNAMSGEQSAPSRFLTDELDAAGGKTVLQIFISVSLGIIVSLGTFFALVVGSADEQRGREQARRRKEEQKEARWEQEHLREQEQQQRNQQEARAQQERQQAQQREKEQQEKEQREKERRDKEQREKEQARREQEKQEEPRRQQEGENERKAKSNGAKTQDWWVVLGIAPDAPLETAKKAYRLKIKQYHPDRVEGLGPEFIQLADQKSKELNTAMDEAKRHARA